MDPARYWNTALSHDAKKGIDFLADIKRIGVVYRDEPLCIFRRPLFIKKSMAHTYLQLIGALHRAIRHAKGIIEEDGLDGRPDSLAIRLGLDPRTIELAAIDPGYASAAVLARFDTFINNDTPHVVELNAEAPAGMAFSDRLARLFLNDPCLPGDENFTAMFSAHAAARSLVDTWRTHHNENRPVRVALVDFMDVPTRSEFLIFRDEFVSMGHHCVLSDPRSLDFDGKRLTHNGQHIDIVYRRLLVSDLIERPDDCQALLDAYRAGRVLMVNSLRTSLLHGKGLFALLHDPTLQQRLPNRVVEIIRKHVPWTAILSDQPAIGTPSDLRSKLLAEPHRWIIKPLHGHGGTGVVIGAECDSTTWSTAIDNAHSHVAQAYVAPNTELFPDATKDYEPTLMRTSLAPFLVRGKLTGFMCRLTTSLGNVSEGATMVPVLIQTN